jgi:5-formyltetrahydrofolate cyclo-ligase
MDKAEFRKRIKQLKKSYDFSKAQHEADVVFDLLKSLRAYKEAKNILLYYAMPDELPTAKFINEEFGKKAIFLPRISGNDLELVKYTGDLRQNDKFNVLEPSGSELASLTDIQLAVVPGVAFDKHCNRLGRGKGYYDKLLEANNVFKIGVAFDFQFKDEIPTTDNDIKMNAVLTPSHIVFHH